MTAMTFAACLLIAFSPTAAFWGVIVGRRAQSIILFLTSAFTWIVAILFSSLFFLIPGIKSVWIVFTLLTVAIQEGSRLLYIHMYYKGVDALKAKDKMIPLNNLASSFAAGVGFGSIHSVIMYGSVLVYSTGEGALYIETCPISIFLSSAIATSLFSLLHVSLMVNAFYAFRNNSLWKSISVVALHAIASSATLLTSVQGAGCQASLPIIAGVLAVSLVLSLQPFTDKNY